MEKMFIVDNSSAVAYAFEGLLDSFFGKCPTESSKLLTDDGSVIEGLRDMMDLVNFMTDNHGRPFEFTMAEVMADEIVEAAEKLYTEEALAEMTILETCKDMDYICYMTNEVGEFPIQ